MQSCSDESAVQRTWGVTPMVRVEGGMLRPLGMEISAKLLWRGCDQSASQDTARSDSSLGRLRMMVRLR